MFIIIYNMKKEEEPEENIFSISAEAFMSVGKTYKICQYSKNQAKIFTQNPSEIDF